MSAPTLPRTSEPPHEPAPRVRTAERAARWGWSLSGLVALFALWWAAADLLGLSERGLLASPWEALARLAELTVNPLAGETLLGHTAASLGRWAGGFGAALVIGLPLGFAFAWYPVVRAALGPTFEVLRFIAPFAWIPFAILWLEPGYFAQSFVVFVGAAPPVVLAAESAVRGVDRALIQAGRVLGASRTRTLFGVAIPTSGPGTLVGVRIAVSNGWMSLMAAEMIVGTSGLGYLILAGQQGGDAAAVVGGMVLIGVLGALLDRLVVRVSAPLTHWRKGLESGSE